MAVFPVGWESALDPTDTTAKASSRRGNVVGLCQEGESQANKLGEHFHAALLRVVVANSIPPDATPKDVMHYSFAAPPSNDMYL